MKKLTCSVLTLCLFSTFTVAQVKKKADSLKQSDIEELVIVAFGKQKKETIVGSNTQINSEKFAGRAITNVASALDGASPGVQLAAGSGQPGSAPSVVIRGFGSVNGSNQPLYIVDGVMFTNALATLNPDDIASFNILKDAASTSLYGSSAANGVVLITTKKGKSGKDQFSFNLNTGMSQRAYPQYDRVSAAQYYPLVWQAIRNGRLTSGASATVALANAFATTNLITVLKQNVFNVPDNQLVVDGVLNPNARLKYSDLDWDPAVARTGFRQSYDMNYSGGNSKTTYYASLGYLNETGYIIKSDLERFSGRLSVDSKLKDWLKVGLNIAATNNYSNSAVSGADNPSSLINPYYFSRRMGPIYSPYLHDANGQNVYDSSGDKVYDINQARGADAYSGRHTIVENLLNSDISKSYNVNSRFNLDVKITKNLTFTNTVGYDTRSIYNRSYTNNVIGDAAPAGAASRTSTYNQAISTVQLLNYKKKFGFHDFELMLGHESFKQIIEYFYGYKQGLVGANNDDLINFITPTSLTSTTDKYNKEGYFSRFNYNYKEKYMLSASVRKDGSSKFAYENRWGTFYSVGAAWRINKESFLENVKQINDLKLRGSYGGVGNDQGISFYAYQNLFQLNYNNANEPGVYLGPVADRSITWEKNIQKDIALDFALFNNRVSGTVELYKRESNGLLFSVPTPRSAGVFNNSISSNVGDMFNKGIEIQLNLAPVRTENFSWDLTLNASKNINEITKLPVGQNEIINGTKKWMVGRSMFDFWLRQWYGVDSSDGAGLYLLDENLAGTTVTDIRSVNGVRVTTNANKALYAYSGTSVPDWFGSINNTLRYKNLSLSTLFTYQIGGKIYDSNYSQLMSGYPQGIALSTDILNAWTTPGQVTDVPKLDSQLSAQYSPGSNRWLTDASYLTLRSATVSYQFNREFLNNFGMTNFKLFITGENLFAKTARKGMEPAENFSGTTVNRYSPARIFSFGLSSNF